MSLKEPFFYFGASALFLLVFAAFFSHCFWCSSENYIFANPLFEQKLKANETEQRLFVGPNNLQPESPEFYLIQNSGLLGVSPPVTVTQKVLGVMLGEPEPEVRKEIIEYQVQSGDSLSTIAQKFEISLNTILWANNLSSKSIIRPGQKLTILPISGIVHHIKTGDTISEIAQKYKAETKDIVIFNELSSENDIFVGDILVIPDGKIPAAPRRQDHRGRPGDRRDAEPPLHHRPLPAGQGHRPGRRGRFQAPHGDRQPARRAGRGAASHHPTPDRARGPPEGERHSLP